MELEIDAGRPYRAKVLMEIELEFYGSAEMDFKDGRIKGKGINFYLVRLLCFVKRRTK
jgi:hypothetical protein